MANLFDQFDNAPPPNAFDQFDVDGPVAPVAPTAEPMALPSAAELILQMSQPRAQEPGWNSDWQAGKLAARQGFNAMTDVAPGLMDIGAAQNIRDIAAAGEVNLAAAPQEVRDELLALNLEINDLIERVQLGDMIPGADQRLAVLNERKRNLQAAYMTPYGDTADLQGRAAEREERGMGRVVEGAQTIGELAGEMEAYPVDPRAAEVLGADDWRGALGGFVSNPGVTTRTALIRSLPAMLPAIAGGVGGFAVGGPGGAALGGGLTGAGVEFSMSLSEQLQTGLSEAGVDINDAAAVEAFATQNPDAMDAMIETAAIRAGIIGAVDAVSSGVAGKVIQGGQVGNRVGNVGRIAAATGVEAAGEGTGEALAQKVTTGEVHPGDVLAETIAGLAMGAPSSTIMAATEAQRTPGRILSREMDRALTQGPNVDAVVQPQEAVSQKAPAPEVMDTVIAPPINPVVPEVEDEEVQQEQPVAGNRVAPTATPLPEPAQPPVADTPPQQPAAPQDEPVANPFDQFDEPVQSAEPEDPPADQPEVPQSTRSEPVTEGVTNPDTPARPRQRVYTPDGDEIEVETKVVEADTLLTSDQEGYPAELQPRDRSRAASLTQIEGIANRPIAARLDSSPETDRGAPIVGPDGSIVESGNGRTMGLRLAYERGTAEEYRAYVQANYPEAAGMRNPVIVRQRVTDTDARDFAVASNTSATLSMSATEQARADSRLVDDDVLSLYRGGEIGSASNRDMVRSFIKRLPQSVQNEMTTAEGGLSVAGQQRFQSALFHRAYGNDALLKRLAENPDNDIKSVTGALSGAAPAMARLKNQIERGEVSPDVDLSEALTQAVNGLIDIRARESNLRDQRAQTDAFAEPTEPAVDMILSAFYNEAGTRMASKQAMQSFFEEYAALASEQRVDQANLPGIEAKPLKAKEEILSGIQEQDDGQTDLFGADDASGSRSQSSRESGAEAQRPSDDADRAKAPRKPQTQPVEDEGSLLDAAPDRNDRIGRRPPGRPSVSFLRFSITNKPSVFRAAFEDAGLSEAQVLKLSPEQQIEVLSKLLTEKYGIEVVRPKTKIRKKNRFGRKTVETKAAQASQETIDNLLDAYRNFEMLAALMQMPNKALALEIDGKPLKLSLTTPAKLRGALGMFSWNSAGDRIIHMPGRSNSFAHEWGHAFDHFLNQKVNRPSWKGMLTRNQSAKGLTQKYPANTPKAEITEGFAHVIWAMYGDKSSVGAWVLGLQMASAQVDANGKPTPAALRAIDALKDIREGKMPPKALMSDFAISSQEFDDAVGADGYFTDPAEMFARAFETWVGREVSRHTDLPQTFLSKGGWAYTADSDERLSMTFPKNVDADQFAIAMVKLADGMRRMKVMGEDAPATMPADPTTYDLRELTLTQKEAPNRWKRETQEFTAMIDRLKMAPASIRASLKSSAVFFRQFYQTVINTGGEAMWAVATRQKSDKAKEALLNIAREVAKVKPGWGYSQKEVWQESVERTSKRRINQITNAVQKYYGGQKLGGVELEIIKSLMIGQSPTGASQRAVKLATALRSILNEVWYDLRSAGIQVGYTGKYLPHILQSEKVDENPSQFQADATKVYKLIFNREVRDNEDAEGQWADIKSIVRGLASNTLATADGDRAVAPAILESEMGVYEDVKRLQSEIKALDKRIKEAKRADTVERLTAQREALVEEHGEKFAELLNILEERYSAWSAQRYFNTIGVGQLNDFASIGPTANFLKQRSFPPEAGEILAPYMMDNPIELVTGYVFQAARRAEYAKRFGADNSKLENMLRAARDAGATAEDIEFFKVAMNAATGRMVPSSTGWSRMRNWTFTVGNLTMLTSATLTSLAETTVAGMRTGNVTDGLRPFLTAMSYMVRKGQREQLKDLASVIGIIAPHTMETVMENRISADAMHMSAGQQNMIGRFFTLNGLTPLTNFQRVVMQPVANKAVLRLLQMDAGKRRGKFIRDKVAGKGSTFANDELNELGLTSKEDRERLMTWMEEQGGLPTGEAMFGPDGNLHPEAELYAVATNRLINEIIQNPMKTDRAIQANHPDHAALYGIMSFMDAFTRHILLRNLQRGFKEGDNLAVKGLKSTANLALMTGPALTLFGTHFLITAAREALTNREQWEKHEEEGDLLEWLRKRAFSRSGLRGRTDVITNLITGLRYDRDLTTITAGPYLGQMLQGIFTIAKAGFGGRNSENTNTAEYNAGAAAYRLALLPAINAALTMISPTSAILGTPGRILMYKAASYDTSTDFAEMLFGEKGEKHQNGQPWWELGD